MRIVNLGLMILFFGGCAHQQDLMKANAVSMKHRNLPAGTQLVKVADIRAEYCMESFKSSSGQDIGLMDEVIKKAESAHNIDFIVNASFRSKGKCIVVEGDGMRIQ